MTKAKRDLTSSVIAAMRFPLIAAVVLSHTAFRRVYSDGVELIGSGHAPFYQWLSQLLSGVMSHVAVAVFFIISGFLFFRSSGRLPLPLSFYGTKWSRRVRTLLVPYVMWNLLILAIYWLLQTWFPAMTHGVARPVSDYGFRDVLYSLWDMTLVDPHADGHFPVCTPMWFVRDLMVVMLCAPVLHWLVSRLRWLPVALLGVAWVLVRGNEWPGLGLMALFFFTLGAWRAIDDVPLLVVKGGKQVALLVVLWGLTAALSVHFPDGSWGASLAFSVSMLLGVLAVLGIARWCHNHVAWTWPQWMAKSTFFIYGYHGIALLVFRRKFLGLLPLHGDATITLTYLLLMPAVVLVGCVLATLLRRIAPHINSLLTGTR